MEKPFVSSPVPQPALQGPSASAQKHFIAMNPSTLTSTASASATGGGTNESAIISCRNEILISLDHSDSNHRRRVPISPNLHTVGDAHSFLPAVPGPYDFVDEGNDDAREHDNEPLIIRGSARQGRIHQFLTAMRLKSSDATETVAGPTIVAGTNHMNNSIGTHDTSGTRRARMRTRPSREPSVPESTSNTEDPRWNHSISSSGSSSSSTHCSQAYIEAEPKTLPKFPLGILLAALSCIFFATTSLIVKVSALHPMELLAARGLLQGLCVLLVAISSKADLLGTNQNIRSLLLARGILGSASLVMSFISIHLIALADSSTLIFTSPVFVSIFACLCLGEVCSWFDMLMITLTLIGVVFVSKPSFQFMSPNTDMAGPSSWDGVIGSMCGLGAALFTALAFIILRQLKQIHYSVIILWFSGILALFGTVLTIVLRAFTMPSDWCSISQCLGVGLCGFLGQVLLTKALQIETATTVAIARTLDIVFAFLLQIVLLHDTPDLFSCLGSVLVVSCVVLTACRGRAGAGTKEATGNAGAAGAIEDGLSEGVVVAGPRAGTAVTCSTVQLDQEDAA